MTENELVRMDIIGRVDRREITATQATQALDLSVRQVRRLVRVLREKGTKGLIHGNRGRPSPRRLPEETRTQAMELLRTEYCDYNTSHARDELEAEHGLGLSYSAVRRLRLEAGLQSPKRHRVSQHRRRRERAAQEGLLLQTDGSDHDWLEGRGPRMCLIAYIDDATGQIAGACFREAEDAAGYMMALKDICTRQGVPAGVYTDRHTIFQSPKQATTEQKLNGEKPLSQFGRVLSQLGIAHIAAQSPQAKGRVERLFGTLQDRLVKELRRGGTTTLAQANDVLAKYLAKFNRRFACSAVDPQPAYRPWPDGLRAEQVFAFQYRRVVGADHTVAFDGLRLPIVPTPHRRSYARAKVDVYLHLDGRLTIHHQDQQLAVFAHDPQVPVRADTFVPAEPIVYRPTRLRPEGSARRVAAPAEPPPPQPARPVTKPGPNHPWRKSYKGTASPKPVTFSQTNEGDIFTG